MLAIMWMNIMLFLKFSEMGVYIFFLLSFLSPQVSFPSYHTLDTGWSSWLTEGSPSLGESFGETSWAVDVVGDWMGIMAVDGERDTDLWLMDVASSKVSSMSVKETDFALYHTTASTINANIITLPVIPGAGEIGLCSRRVAYKHVLHVKSLRN